jgi:hypothetical protein
MPMVKGIRMMLRLLRILKLWDVIGMMKLMVYLVERARWVGGTIQERMVSRSDLGNQLLFSGVH